MKRKTAITNRPVRSQHVPVTLEMLGAMEGRLGHKIESTIHGIKSDIHVIKSDIHDIKSDIHGIKSELHRVALLVEEQNARNKYVLDGYAQLYNLIERKLG